MSKKWKTVKSLKSAFKVFNKDESVSSITTANNQEPILFDSGSSIRSSEQSDSEVDETIEKGYSKTIPSISKHHDIVDSIKRRLSICSESNVELVTLNQIEDDIEHKELSVKINELLDTSNKSSNAGSLMKKSSDLKRKPSMSVQKLDSILNNVDSFLVELDSPSAELRAPITRSKSIGPYQWKRSNTVRALGRVGTVKVTPSSSNSLQDRLKSAALSHTLKKAKDLHDTTGQATKSNQIAIVMNSAPALHSESSEIREHESTDIKEEGKSDNEIPIPQGSVDGDSIKKTNSIPDGKDSPEKNDLSKAENVENQGREVNPVTSNAIPKAPNAAQKLSDLLHGPQGARVVKLVASYEGDQTAQAQNFKEENLPKSNIQVQQIVLKQDIKPMSVDIQRTDSSSPGISSLGPDVEALSLLELSRTLSAQLEEQISRDFESLNPKMDLIPTSESEKSVSILNHEKSRHFPKSQERTLEDVFDIIEVVQQRSLIDQRAFAPIIKKPRNTDVEPILNTKTEGNTATLDDIIDIIDSMQKYNLNDQRAIDPRLRKRQKVDQLINSMMESIEVLEKSDVNLEALNELYASMNKIRQTIDIKPMTPQVEMNKSSRKKWLRFKKYKAE